MSFFNMPNAGSISYNIFRASEIRSTYTLRPLGYVRLFFWSVYRSARFEGLVKEIQRQYLFPHHKNPIKFFILYT